MNIPTWITVSRIIIIPFFVLFFYIPYSFGPLFSALIFFIASLTDWLDGFLARRWEQTTLFGAFVDPIIDKILVIIAFVLIVEHFHAWWITSPVSVIIIREVVISALREWIAKLDYGVSIFVSKVSKVKTTVQMVSVILLLWHPNDCLILIGIIMLYFSCVLTVWSVFGYFYLAYSFLKR